MRSRSVLALAVVLAVALSGCSALSDPGSPYLSVENRDDAEYRLAVYVVDVDDRANLTFRATTADGTRTTVGASDLRNGTGYRNVTLDAAGADSQRITIRGAANTSASINMWQPGDATVYVIETADGTASLVGAYAITCDLREQDHEMTIEDGTLTRRSATCP